MGRYLLALSIVLFAVGFMARPQHPAAPAKPAALEAQPLKPAPAEEPNPLEQCKKTKPKKPQHWVKVG
jgi:hypothetical protein